MLRGNRFSGWSPLQDTHNSTILSPASTPGFPTRTLQRLSFARRRSTSDPSEQPGILTRAWTKEGSLPTQQRDEEDEEITLERILDGKTKSPASLKDLKAFAGTVDAERRRRGELETVKVLTFLTAYKERVLSLFLAEPPADLEEQVRDSLPRPPSRQAGTLPLPFRHRLGDLPHSTRAPTTHLPAALAQHQLDHFVRIPTLRLPHPSLQPDQQTPPFDPRLSLLPLFAQSTRQPSLPRSFALFHLDRGRAQVRL